jgi:hypothetical protein
LSLSVNTKTYNPDSYRADSVRYVGPLNTVSVKDAVVLGRTAPKPTTEFSGVGRTLAKLTRTLPLTGALTPSAEGIVEISAQIPVGAAAADVDALAADMGAWIASTQGKALLKSLLVNQ